MLHASHPYILVAGWAGFLGQSRCRKLLETGQAALCIDNLSSDTINNLQKLEKFENFIFWNLDITRFDLSNFSSMKISGIYNLVCQASPPWYQSDPIGEFGHQFSELGVFIM